MSRMRIRIASALFASAAFAIFGCDREGASQRSQGAAAQPPTASQAAPADLSKVNDFLRETAGPRQPELPQGHPPSGAAPAPVQLQGALPPGHPPLSGTGAAPAVTGLDLKFESPASWKSETPTSQMRKAQYVIPRAGNDSEDGELVVFYFGRGEGGTVEANIERWRGMFSNSAGNPLSDSDVHRQQIDAGGLKVTLVEIDGRYAAAMAPGGPAGPPKDNYKMLSAVVETSNGPWFFKGVGPAATMAAHREEFNEMLKSVRP